MKRTDKILSTAILAMGLLLSGCNNYLDIRPKGYIIPEATKDYEALLNGADIMKASESYPNYLTDDAYIPSEDATGFLIGLNTTERYIRNLYTFQKNTYGTAETDGLWDYTYNRIFTYNVLINEVMDSQDGSEAEKKVIQAEAYVGRAFEYLNLVNAYAVHYDPTTANTDPAVPLIKEADISLENLTRATVAEVYQLIESDLLSAIPYLPEKPKGTSFRASKAAGLGILARTYLYQGRYEEALRYANEALNYNDKLIDLNDYTLVMPDGFIGRSNVPELDKNPENLYTRMAPYVFGLAMNVYGSEDLMTLYSDSDQRKTLYFTKKPFGMAIENYLWLPGFMANLAIATPEVYLIAAEAEARVGSPERATELLNTLRSHRIANYTPLTTGSKEEVLREVLNERRRELVFSGLHRLIDLKRLNKDPRFAKSITHNGSGSSTHTLEPNSPKYVLPIPDKVLQFNPDMQPNQR